MSITLPNSFLQIKPSLPPESDCNTELQATSDVSEERYPPRMLKSAVLVVVDADQVDKFRKKFGQFSEIMEIPVLKGELVPVAKPASRSR
ncbi:hypothetical protein PTKIN_Ptkin09bG0116800 [Pterospermum kingtungense]